MLEMNKKPNPRFRKNKRKINYTNFSNDILKSVISNKVYRLYSTQTLIQHL